MKKFMVECRAEFEQVHDLGPALHVSTGDCMNWSSRPNREVRDVRASRRRFVQGELIEFSTLASAMAFMDNNKGKFVYRE